MKKISETKNTCQACGNVWYYGKSEQLENFGNSMSQLGKSMMCCSGCFPALLIPDKKVNDLHKCPKCSSKAVKSKQIVHEVEYYLSLGEYTKALLMLSSDTRAINNSRRLLQLGNALLGLHRNKEATNAFKKASTLTDLLPEPTIQLAIALAADGQFLSANKTLKKLSQIHPSVSNFSYWYNCSAQEHVEQGRKYLSQGFNNIALRCFEIALIINPNNKQALKYRDKYINWNGRKLSD